MQVIQNYAKALKHNHQLAAAYFGRGIAYSELVQNQRPLGSFNEYVRLAPNDADGYEYRGRIHESLDQYERAIPLVSRRPISYDNRGNAYYELDEDKEAIQGYRIHQAWPATRLA